MLGSDLKKGQICRREVLEAFNRLLALRMVLNHGPPGKIEWRGAEHRVRGHIRVGVRVTRFLHDFVDNTLSNLLFLHTGGVGRALSDFLEAVDAACPLEELDQSLAGGILDLQHLAGMPNALTLFHSEAHECTSRLGRNRIIAVAGSLSAAFECAILLFDSVR